MFNLIPEQYKQLIAHDYTYRRVIVWCVGVCILFFCLIIFILPSYIFVYFNKESVEDQLQYMHSSTAFKNATIITKEISAINEQLKLLSLAQAIQIQPSKLMEAALSVKNERIHIIDIEYSHSDDGGASIVITGTADTRDALRMYVTELQNNSVFSKVDLPVSSFTKDTHIEFTLTLTHHE